ncbi:hypothetical protein [Tsukamurella soli]|uniref:Uncharacterized protein n=1 Tax=Tsukamurella soli TaxID=644556 RepID=A0ABP8J2D7_9ACTN
MFSASDFTIDVIVTKSHCFGSAGCNVSYTITPHYIGSTADLAGADVRVIYRVLGGEEPVTDSFTLTGTSVPYTDESTLETESSDYKLTAEVTQVVDQ